MDMKELKITKECCDWLAPFTVGFPDSSYEQSAVDAVLNHVMKLEKTNIELCESLKSSRCGQDD